MTQGCPLHGSGRVAEALQQYRPHRWGRSPSTVRRALIDELGLEPGVRLWVIHQSILNGESIAVSTHPTTADTRHRSTSPGTPTRPARLVPA
jgi:hypothetical protein